MFSAGDLVLGLVGTAIVCSLPATWSSGRHGCCVFFAGDLVSGMVGMAIVCSVPATWFRVW